MFRNSSRGSRIRSNEEVRRRTVNPGLRGRAIRSESDVRFEFCKIWGLEEEEPTYLEGAGRERLKGKAIVELRLLSKENGVGGSEAARMRAIHWIKRKRQTRARSNMVRVKATQHGNGRLVRFLVTSFIHAVQAAHRFVAGFALLLGLISRTNNNGYLIRLVWSANQVCNAEMDLEQCFPPIPPPRFTPQKVDAQSPTK